MVKTWAIGSLALGVAMFGTALYIQHEPLAFTHAETVIDADTEVVRDEPFEAVVTEQERTEAPAELGSTANSDTPPAARRAVRGVAAPKAEAPLEPCSDWQELGPAHVVDGVAIDSRRVRLLC